MAILNFFEGQPEFDISSLLNDVFANGTFNNVGTGPQTSLSLTSGTLVLVLTGTGLTADTARHLTAGTITGMQLFSGPDLIIEENTFTTAPGFAPLNDIIAAYDLADEEAMDDAINAFFFGEGLTVNGSNAGFDDLPTSDFNDIVNGNGGDEFIEGSTGTDVINGGSEYDVLGFHWLGGSVNVMMSMTGVAGGGTVTGSISNGAVNTTFADMERVVGTENADTFLATPDFQPTFDNNFAWVGGGGNDTFTSYGNRNIEVNYNAEKFEQNFDGFWGDSPGELGVLVNLSSTSKTANLGAGNITVAAGQARDTFGTTDTLSGIQQVNMSDANDFFYGGDLGVRVRGQAGNDTIVTGAGSDRISGDAGNDTITAGDGNDDIDGGLGNDTIDAGDGIFDFINGSAGTDTVNGNAGYDDYEFAYGPGGPGNGLAVTFVANSPGGGTAVGTLYGDAVNASFQNIERIGGTNGNDSFTANLKYASTEDARMFWGTSLTQIVAADGNDTITDNSKVVGGVFMVDYEDEQWAHENFDGYWGDSAGEYGVIINLGTGSITVDVGNGPETVASGQALDTFGATDSFTNQTNFILTNADDYVRAGLVRLIIKAKDGDDTVIGGSGRDLISGENGDDTLNGGAQNDRIEGGDGLDTIVGGSGADMLWGDNGNDTITGDAGNDEIDGGDGDDTINGGAGADVMFGGMGHDTVTGDGGSDELHGGEGDDTITGGLEADVMFGDGGHDTFYVDNAGDQVFEFDGEGNDTVYSSVTYGLTAGYEIENLILSGVTSISGFGNDYGNTITGNSAINTLAGGGGNDTLLGNGGADVLIGGTGLDTFRYDSRTYGGDTVMDFNSADDTFAFKSSAFSSLALGGIAANQWQSGTSDVALTSTVRFFYETDTGILRFDSNGSGGGNTTIIATLQPGVTMDISDILIV